MRIGSSWIANLADINGVESFELNIQTDSLFIVVSVIDTVVLEVILIYQSNRVTALVVSDSQLGINIVVLF